MHIRTLADNQRKHLADAVCLMIAALWGSGFIASQYAINAGMSATLIVTLRFVIASLALLPFCAKKLRQITKADLKCGIFAGTLVCLSFLAQISGQARTTVSHTAFLTTTSVVLIPFLMWIFQKKRPDIKTIVLAFTTFIGIGILTYNANEPFGINTGDGLVLLCSLGYAFHIFYLGSALHGKDLTIINFIQMTTTALLSTAALLLFERESIVQADYSIGIPALLFLGVINTCICFMLQIWAQKQINQSRAGILLSAEGLFGSLFAVFLGMEPLTITMACGGLIILVSLVFLEVQIPLPRRRKGERAF